MKANSTLATIASFLPSGLHRISPKQVKDFFLEDYIPTKTEIEIERNYIEAGETFAREVNYIYFMDEKTIDDLLSLWTKNEEEYAKLGFRTISFDDFFNTVRSGQPVNNELLKQPREREKFPKFHSKMFREELRKLSLKEEVPSIDGKKLQKNPLLKGEFKLPSTKNPGEFIEIGYKLTTYIIPIAESSKLIKCDANQVELVD